jgi:hypothetical protein
MTPAVIPVPTLRSGHLLYLALTNGVRVTVRLEAINDNGILAKRVDEETRLSFFPFFNIVEMDF